MFIHNDDSKENLAMFYGGVRLALLMCIHKKGPERKAGGSQHKPPQSQKDLHHAASKICDYGWLNDMHHLIAI